MRVILAALILTCATAFAEQSPVPAAAANADHDTWRADALAKIKEHEMRLHEEEKQLSAKRKDVNAQANELSNEENKAGAENGTQPLQQQATQLRAEIAAKSAELKALDEQIAARRTQFEEAHGFATRRAAIDQEHKEVDEWQHHLKERSDHLAEARRRVEHADRAHHVEFEELLEESGK